MGSARLRAGPWAGALHVHPDGGSGWGSLGPCPCRRVTGPGKGRLGADLLQQRQLAEELLGAVLGQEAGPLLAGLGAGPVEVLEEAGLRQGRRDAVLSLLVGQGRPAAPGEPPGEALQGRSPRSGRARASWGLRPH